MEPPHGDEPIFDSDQDELRIVSRKPAHEMALGVNRTIFSMMKGGIPTSRPSRENVLQRLSEALLRRSLTKVRLSEDRIISFAHHLTKLLCQIDLSQRGLRPSDARLVKMALLQNSQLAVLKLGYNNLGDEGVSILATGICQHSSLQSLDLGFNNIGDEGCRELATAIATSGNLLTLYLAGNLIGEDGAMAIADLIRQCGSLQKLYLTGNELGPEGVKAIVVAILEDEMSRFNDHDKAFEEKADDTSNQSACGIEQLFLGGTGIGPSGCHAVARLLARTCRLRVLSLPNCEIGDEALAQFASSIKENREGLPLESLQLSFNRITCRGIEALANAIWGSSTLRELLLDNNEIGNRGCQQLAAVIPYVKTLETLNVGFNTIEPSGIKLLMKAVAETQSLASLSVSGNKIDNAAAKAVAYGLAYNRSLVSLSLVHCSIGHDAKRHITAGVVSNCHLALRQLTGFELGPVTVTLGFPAALEHWNNDQILNFIHLMWDKSRGDVTASEEEKKMDPLHFLDEPIAFKAAPVDANVVVEVAKKAFAALVSDGVDVFSRRAKDLNDHESPIAGDSIVVESRGEDVLTDEGQSESSLEPMPTHKTPSFVAPPETFRQSGPDPARKKRIVEWLCSHIQHLNKLGNQQFSSADLWRLHQHYFTPVVNESGGSVSSTLNRPMDNASLTISSVPEVSRTSSGENQSNTFNDASDNSMPVPISDPSMQASPGAITSLPLLKRKVSYRLLGDAALALPSRPKASAPNNSVSHMIEGGPTGHSLRPKTKRARRNRSRISFLPRVKAKLDSYLDVCHEKALATMRQLYYVEQAILAGKVNPIDPATTRRTHLCGDFAADAEMIVVDMI